MGAPIWGGLLLKIDRVTKNRLRVHLVWELSAICSLSFTTFACSTLLLAIVRVRVRVRFRVKVSELGLGC